MLGETLNKAEENGAEFIASITQHASTILLIKDLAGLISLNS